MARARICEEGGDGLFLSPLGSKEKPQIAMGLVFAIVMVYFFLGVSIIADMFMNSIEAVTSWKRKVMDKDKGRKVTVNLWNETVATLTLMALGSSAPEIFLSVIETLKREFHAGDLGPSTIVGSAAFNLFSIIAVCIMVIPKKEVRWIENMNAFLVTAVFSVGAYMWMVFVLVIHGQDVVDPIEAVMTLVWLPVLVWISYSVDVGWLSQILARCSGGSDEPDRLEEYSHFIGFERDEISVVGEPKPQEVSINVLRKGGLRTHVLCTYRTEKLNAMPGFDFEESAGTVDFPTGSTSQTITINVLPKRASAVARSFMVILESADTTCDFHPDSDGPEEQCILTVNVEAITTDVRSSGASIRRAIDSVTNTNHFYFAWEDWKEQMVSSVYCNGSAEEQKDATISDWIFHVVSLPWKLLFALVPSTGFFGGWLAFFVSICLIGVLTAALSDLAEMFGCLLDVPDIVTAMTFVALGTSMPDLFASLSAATQDPTADASIVNVTGSNSVNVFLGLGLPWTMASIYWMTAERDADWELRYPEVATNVKYAGSAVFVVESRNLGFCVMVFSGLCLIALLLLVMRRKYLGAELGGPTVPKIASGVLLIWLWLAFVALTSWRVLRCEGASPGDWCKASIKEQGIVCGGVFLTTFFVALPTLISTKWYSSTAKQEALESKRKRQRSSSVEDCSDAFTKQGYDNAKSLSKISEETNTTSRLSPAPPSGTAIADADAGDAPTMPDIDELEPADEIRLERVFSFKLGSRGEGAAAKTPRKIDSRIVSILPTMAAAPPHHRKNIVVNVIVVAYHSSGKNETCFDIKLSTPVSKVMRAWCQKHGLDLEKAQFKMRGRKVSPDDTATSLGHDPTKGPMVLKAFPLRDGSSKSKGKTDGSANV